MDEFEAIGVIPKKCRGKTLADYQKTAKAAVAEAIKEEVGKDKFIPLGALYFHVERAFRGAVAISMQSRDVTFGPNGKPEQSEHPLVRLHVQKEIEKFIFLFMQLEEDWEHICQVYGPKLDLQKDWPRNSGVTFGGQSSWCFLVLAVGFSEKILSTLKKVQTSSGIDLDNYRSVKFYPNLDSRIECWRNSAMRCLLRDLPPSGKWEKYKIREDAEKLLWKLDDEVRQANANEQKKTTDSTPEAPAETDLTAETDSRQKDADFYEVTIGKGICNIGKSVQLLIDIIADINREGVACKERTYKSFRRFFREKGYTKMLEQFVYDKRTQKLSTKIPVGKIFIKKK